MESNKNEDKNKGVKDQKNWFEWLVFAFSLAIVTAIVAYLSYQIYSQTETSPDLFVVSTPDPAEHAPFRYHVTVFNKGGTTAEEVLIELTLEKEGATLEKAELQMPYSPQDSEREAWVTFSKDPSLADTLVARVVSYKKP